MPMDQEPDRDEPLPPPSIEEQEGEAWEYWHNRAIAAEIERHQALKYAQRLATSLWEQHWKADAPEWKPLPELVGVLTQIDNAVAGLVRPIQTAEQT